MIAQEKHHANKSVFDGRNPPNVDEVAKATKSCLAGLGLDELDMAQGLILNLVPSKLEFHCFGAIALSNQQKRENVFGYKPTGSLFLLAIFSFDFLHLTGQLPKPSFSKFFYACVAKFAISSPMDAHNFVFSKV